MQWVRVGKGQVSEMFFLEKKNLLCWVRGAYPRSVCFTETVSLPLLRVLVTYGSSAQKFPSGWMGYGERNK